MSQRQPLPNKHERQLHLMGLDFDWQELCNSFGDLLAVCLNNHTAKRKKKRYAPIKLYISSFKIEDQSGQNCCNLYTPFGQLQ